MPGNDWRLNLRHHIVILKWRFTLDPNAPSCLLAGRALPLISVWSERINRELRVFVVTLTLGCAGLLDATSLSWSEIPIPQSKTSRLIFGAGAGPQSAPREFASLSELESSVCVPSSWDLRPWISPVVFSLPTFIGVKHMYLNMRDILLQRASAQICEWPKLPFSALLQRLELPSSDFLRAENKILFAPPDIMVDVRRLVWSIANFEKLSSCTLPLSKAGAGIFQIAFRQWDWNGHHMKKSCDIIA